MQLYPDKPQSKGVENALKRARQMVEIKWTPRNKIPCGYIFSTPTEKKWMDAWLPGHLPQVGMIYSSPRIHGKFVGTNVSIETFMTALANPNSVLYTRPQHGLCRSGFSFYGIVCSVFASYVCQLPNSIACAGWLKVPGVSSVDLEKLEDLQLCDMLLSKTHIAVITEILRDVNGIVRQISVSESTTPRCRCTAFTPEEFRSYWLEGGYQVIRYAGIHNVTYTPSPYVPLEDDPYMEPPVYNTTFMADYGDKANYKLGETVEFSIFEEGWETIEISGPDGIATSLPIAGSTVTYAPEAPGFYTAVCRKGDQASRSVEFCAVWTELALGKDVFSVGEPIRGSFRALIPGDEIFHVTVSSHDLFHRVSRALTPEELAEQRTNITDTLAPGKYVLGVAARGKYGIYVTRTSVFTVE